MKVQAAAQQMSRTEVFSIASHPILLKVQPGWQHVAGTFTLPLPSASRWFWEQSTAYSDSQCAETPEAVDTKCL